MYSNEMRRRFILKSDRLRTFSIALVLLFVIMLTHSACSAALKEKKIPVRVLILPKFEIGEMTGDFPGEAQYFYEEYFAGGEEFEIGRVPDSGTLYYKNGAAMLLLGQGKVNAALSTAAVLSDERFDFSDAYIFSVGCGGSAKDYGILGDVFVISAAVDYDLGHQADPRESGRSSETTWFHDESFDSSAVVRMDERLTDRVYQMVKDIPLETTEKSVAFLQREFPGEAWADRPPRVLRGTVLTGDNYWKGIYDHKNALLMTETYHCTDPFAITEMEDVAVGLAVKSFRLLDRMIILRTGVNMDVFPAGVTPEMLWGTGVDDHIASETSMESIDIFETAMKNCFLVGKVLIDAMLEGSI